MLPATFRDPRTLRFANTLAIGATLASLTGSAIQTFFASEQSRAGVVSALTTFFFGTLWALALRLRRRVTPLRIQVGWLLCVPLAALNAGAAASMAFSNDPALHMGWGYVTGAFLGMTFGAIIWVPALVSTLVCFGIPIARAQRLAARGLAGEERGEQFVGWVCTLLGIIAVAASAAIERVSPAARAFFAALGGVGAVSGSLAAWLAHERTKRRNAFVSEAEAGRVEGYRVQVVPEGKVLVRVETGKEVYRGGERFEAVYELAADGSARRAL